MVSFRKRCATFAELAAPWMGRKTGMDHDLRERLRNMDARPLRLMKEAGLATHTRTEEIDRVCEVTLAVEHLPGIRLRRTLLIPSQAYGIRRQLADDLLYFHTLTFPKKRRAPKNEDDKSSLRGLVPVIPLCVGTFTSKVHIGVYGDLKKEMKKLRARISRMLYWYKKSAYVQFGFQIHLLMNDFAFARCSKRDVKVNGHVNFFYTLNKPMPKEIWTEFCQIVRKKFQLGFYIDGPVRSHSDTMDYMAKLYKAERTKPDEILFSDLSDEAAIWFLEELNGMRNITPKEGFAAFRKELKTQGEKVVRKKAVPTPMNPSPGHELVRTKKLTSRILSGADGSPFPKGSVPKESVGPGEKKAPVENMIVARERPSPTAVGIWQPHTLVKNFTLTPVTEQGKRNLGLLRRHHLQALGWAQKNGWFGRPSGALARLFAPRHNPDVRTSFMYANSPRLRIDRVDDGVLGGALWREIMAAEVAMRAKQGDVRRHI